MLFNIHFQKWSLVTVKENDETINSKIDPVKVFDAILTSRQTRQKLQWLYENLMSNNFRRTTVLKKIRFVN